MSFFWLHCHTKCGYLVLSRTLCGVVVSMALFGSVLVWFMRGFASLKSSAIESEKMLRENENKLRDSYQKEIQALKKEISELKISNAFSEYYAGRDKNA